MRVDRDRTAAYDGTRAPARRGWAAVAAEPRPRVGGKFLFAGGSKLYVHGVTYGAFRPGPDGTEYHDVAILERDFAQMAAHGVNTVRIPHTTPPRHLLDVAQRHGLRVMIGLSAEQHIGYLIDKKKSLREIAQSIRARARTCAGHPALLCYALGNEIPGPVARWYGRRGVERYLKALYEAVKEEDPEGLVTYVNYPTTEYLELPFLDLVCYNVYLESQDRLEAYLARLQNIAGDRPLILSEVGLDSLRNGEEEQARSLEWQTRAAFAAGAAGAFVFAWTDEWFRAEADVDDWAFGITDRERRPKPALAAVQSAFGAIPFPADAPWPRASVVVCTHNGHRTIRDCLEGLRRLEYPDYEVIVVDDGSTDATAAIAAEYDVRLIRTGNRGLSSARNTGLQAARGEIVAYLDDDAWPDPHWLHYLAAAFRNGEHAGIGGPNIPPPGNGAIADSVANAPGGPMHVLLSDRVAEHIPGCNMAFRKECLQAIGGFDPRFRVAGDDVDVCWRLQERGWTLGFHPAAMVWHHRRNSLRAYWRQQRGYGRAEALLKEKWPEKYNGTGHVSWAGRIYGRGLTQSFASRQRVYHGTWGAAPFQRLYQSTPSTLYALTLMPEWYVLVPALAAASALGVFWPPLFAALPLLALAVGVPVVQAALSAARASFPTRSDRAPWRLRALTACLHLVHPVARLWGRRRSALASLWRFPTSARTLPRARTWALWNESWQAPEQVAASIEEKLRASGAAVRRGGDWDRWDLEVTAGALGSARLLMGAEDHGGGHQLFRFRWWPKWSAGARTGILLFGGLGAAALLDGARVPGGLLGLLAAFLLLRASLESGAAASAIERTLKPRG